MMRQTTVAIADPFPILREGISVCLANEPDFRILGVASDEQQVTELVNSQHPQVLVLDAALEEGNGSDLIPRLASMRQSPAIVLLTDQDDVESASKAMRQGVTAFVLKIAPVEDLITAVRWAGQGTMWVSPPLLAPLFATLQSHESNKRPSLSDLTDREVEILQLMVEGLGYREISERLGLATNTVRTHTHSIQLKLNVHSNSAAVSVALEEGFCPR